MRAAKTFVDLMKYSVDHLNPSEDTRYHSVRVYTPRPIICGKKLVGFWQRIRTGCLGCGQTVNIAFRKIESSRKIIPVEFILAVTYM